MKDPRATAPFRTPARAPRRLAHQGVEDPPERRAGLFPGWIPLAFTLCLAVTATAQERSHDSLGRVVAQEWEVDGVPRRLEFLYDADGLRVATVEVAGEGGSGTRARSTNRVILNPLAGPGPSALVAELRPGCPARVSLGVVARAEVSAGDPASAPVGYAILDGHGSVRAQVNRVGGLVDRFDSDAFGNRLPAAQDPDAGLPAYSGLRFVPGLGAYGMAFRDYDPRLGRFLSPDPFEGVPTEPASRARYPYARNDPVGRVDPAGTSDYTLQSMLTASVISGGVATLNTYIASHGRATPQALGESFLRGGLVGAGGALVGPIFYAAGAGGRIAFNSYSFATAFWDLGDAMRVRDARLFAFRALTLSIFSAAALQDPTVRVYRVEGEPNTRILVGEDGEVALAGNRVLFLNFGQRERADAFLARQRSAGLPGAVLKSFEVPGSYLRELDEAAVPEDLAAEFPDRPIRVDLDKAPDQFGVRPFEFDRLLEAVRQGTGQIEP
ncbi:MAG TPA: hypothetical protein DCM86_11555 [Verrucomicrobiales bacterium]|nr:hypothetical protein [Verrucomicrobiales bacterium]